MAMNDGGKDSPNKSKNLFDNFKGQAGKRKTYLKQSKEHVNKRALAMKGVARPPNNANAKEFIGKNSVKAKDLNVSNNLNTPIKKKVENIMISKKDERDDWDSF